MENEELEKTFIKSWNRKHLVYNLCLIPLTFVILFISQRVNPASVNFFMTPFVIFDFLVLNFFYRILGGWCLYNFNVRNLNVNRIVAWYTVISLLINAGLMTYAVLKIKY